MYAETIVEIGIFIYSGTADAWRYACQIIIEVILIIFEWNKTKLIHYITNSTFYKIWNNDIE